MYDLKLSANAEAWRLFMLRRADPAFHAFSEKVFRRDRYVCQFCGFQARDYQEVINLNQNYHDNSLKNMTTSCCFCAQCFFLQAIGVGDYGGGTLIFLPEISQAGLNSFCHVLFCAITNDTGYSDIAQNIFRDFKFRSQQIEAQFGEGSSQPSFFGQLIIESHSEKNRNLDTILKDIRVLPSRAGFKTQIEHWASLALQELAENKTT